VKPDALYAHFMKDLAMESNLAHENGQTLLVLIFGHGHFNTRGIELGGYSSTQEWMLNSSELKKGNCSRHQSHSIDNLKFL